MKHRDEAEVDPVVKPRAGEIAGVPATFVVPLVVVSFEHGPGVEMIPASGIYGGVLCVADCMLTMSPAVVPQMDFDHARVAVEITSFDDLTEPPLCTVQMTYLARDGRQRGLITPPVSADGEVVRVPIPTRHLRQGTLLATSVKIVLMDGLPPDYVLEVPDGAVSSGKRPVLVRGAWLEFPHRQE